MTKYDAAWVAAEEAKRKWMAENSLYREEDEHASCGVGLVVSVEGKPTRRVVQAGIDALKAIWHRGAVDADGKTGDGAGIHVQIPVPFSTTRSAARAMSRTCRSWWLSARSSCRAPTSARRNAAGPSWKPKSSAWGTTFTAGGMCR